MSDYGCQLISNQINGLCVVRSQPKAHDDVIKWKYFPRYWPFVRGIHRSPVNSPHKGQWGRVLMISLICARRNSWVNNGEAGDLSRHRAHYDVTVMTNQYCLVHLHTYRVQDWFDWFILAYICHTWIIAHAIYPTNNHLGQVYRSRDRDMSMTCWCPGSRVYEKHFEMFLPISPCFQNGPGTRIFRENNALKAMTFPHSRECVYVWKLRYWNMCVLDIVLPVPVFWHEQQACNVWLTYSLMIPFGVIVALEPKGCQMHF